MLSCGYCCTPGTLARDTGARDARCSLLVSPKSGSASQHGYLVRQAKNEGSAPGGRMETGGGSGYTGTESGYGGTGTGG